MPENVYLKFEELKKHNPWKNYFQNQSDDEIIRRIKAWNDNDSFIHPDDKKAMSKHDNSKKKNRFEYHKLPKPFRGNLKKSQACHFEPQPGIQ